MPYPSKDSPWVVPEILAEELFEDVQYVLTIARERRKLLPADADDADANDATFYVSAELFGLLRIAVIMACASMEAMANQELVEHDLYEQHGRDRLEEKWVLLYEKAGLKPKKGHRPWQSLPRLASLRNKLLHHVPTEIVLAHKPLGSVKLELLGSDGEVVKRLADDAIAIASAYLDRTDPDEAQRIRLQWNGNAQPLMRTLPWMDSQAVERLPRLERVVPDE
jgi:hypothetical protein